MPAEWLVCVWGSIRCRDPDRLEEYTTRVLDIVYGMWAWILLTGSPPGSIKFCHVSRSVQSLIKSSIHIDCEFYRDGSLWGMG